MSPSHPTEPPFATAAEAWSAGDARRRQVLGDAHVDATAPKPDDPDDALVDLVTRYGWGEIWSRPGLTLQTRSFINLAMLTALNRPHELKLHVRGALNNGLSPEEIVETILQTAVYCGLPAAIDSMRVVREVFAE